jgi:hypothetical protein
MNVTSTCHNENGGIRDAYGGLAALLYSESILCIQRVDDSACYIDSRNANLYEACSETGGLFVLSKCNLEFSLAGGPRIVAIDNSGNCATKQEACGTPAGV